MKPIDKKDMPKLIALIGLSVCALGYGVYSLVGGTSSASPPAQAAPKDQTAQAAPVGGGSVPTTDDVLTTELTRLEKISEPVLVRDPFTITSSASPLVPPPTTQLPPSAPNPTPAPSPQDVATIRGKIRAKTLGEILGVSVRLPKPGGEEDPRGGGSATSSGATPHMVLPPPQQAQPPTLSVTGIMVSENGQGKSIAIVRIKDETRWLSVGEDVGQGFVVRSIRRTDSGSELEIIDSNDKKRHFIFKVN
ncbi:hypothetical protein [Armatimonas sp.]|uniref:hypothetical protein n=1 Tax=Armatimonas sp. TaxID=1872638 RepID=UPI00375110EB